MPSLTSPTFRVFHDPAEGGRGEGQGLKVALGFARVWPMKPLMPHWFAYDPRTGADRRFDVRKDLTVSSRAEGLFVLEGPNIDWGSYIATLNALMRATGEHGFVTFVPWSPGHSSKVATVRRAFPDVVELDRGSVLAVGTLPTIGLAERVFDLRDELGGRASGLWAFGSTDAREDFPAQLQQGGDEYDSPIFGVAAVMHIIGFALCLDDGMDTIFSRLTPETEPTLKTLIARLDARNDTK